MSEPDTLFFDVDWSQLNVIGEELEASEKQIVLALSRALRRTASKLQSLSRKGLKTELQVKELDLLRKRLKSVKMRSGMNKLGRMRTFEGVELKYFLNDVPVSWLKGKPTQTKTGAEFRGVQYPGAFVAKSKYGRGYTIFKRADKTRLHIDEQLFPIQDKAQTMLEDRVFVHVEDIFWPLFKRELAARVKYQIGER
jgi:hypothetical protein